jgi:uncharacterized protein (UPF0332 family)
MTSLAGAESEYANGRYDNCANRAYYACYQALMGEFERTGIAPPGKRWSHELADRIFLSELVQRQVRYPRSLVESLRWLRRKRIQADYETTGVTQFEMAQALNRARAFVNALGEKRRR